MVDGAAALMTAIYGYRAAAAGATGAANYL
jgi:hypothetical protein